MAKQKFKVQKALYAGMAPIWYSSEGEGALVYPRGILGSLLLPVAELLMDTYIFIMSRIDETYEPMYMILVDDTDTFEIELDVHEG